jgi:hypothetical protein
MGEIGEWSRVMKEQKKQQKLKHPQRRRCYDWMIVSGNCHYAKNRSSFKTYTHIQGTAGGAAVIGVGSVELLVKRSPEGPGTKKLVLDDVLHIPSAICNGFNPNRKPGRCGITASQGLMQGFVGPGEDQPAWHARDFCGLYRLVLEGNPQGESELRGDGPKLLSIYLSEEEAENLNNEVESGGDRFVSSRQ